MTIVDESLAWGHVLVDYTTEFADHSFGFHCREMDTAGFWTIAYGLELTVQDTVKTLLDTFHLALPTGATFSTIKVYKNNPAPTPAELFFVGTVPTLTNEPDGSSAAAITTTFNFSTNLGRPMKLVFCDCNGSSTPPLRVLPTGFDTIQNGWMNYIINNTNIVTIDGENITQKRSIIVTQNDKLTKAYGLEANTVS